MEQEEKKGFLVDALAATQKHGIRFCRESSAQTNDLKKKIKKKKVNKTTPQNTLDDSIENLFKIAN